MSYTFSVSEGMLEQADANGLPDDHAIRKTAKALDMAARDPHCTNTEVLECWAQARQAWNEYMLWKQNACPKMTLYGFDLSMPIEPQIARAERYLKANKSK